MIDLDPLRPIIVNAANANDTVDLKTTNIVLLTIPNYNNRSLYDTINIYFDDSLYYTYIVNSLVGNMIVDIPKDKIRKQDYNINYTITDSSDNINHSESKVYYFINIDERFKLGEPLFPDARENVIDIVTVSTNGGLRTITDYKYIEAGQKIQFYWHAVYIGTNTVIAGTEYISPEITVNDTDVQNGYKGITIPVIYISPAKDIGIGQCYYMVKDPLITAFSSTAKINIVEENWNDGRLHSYYTSGIARTNPNYPHLQPYNFVTVVGKPGTDAIIETSQGMLIDVYNGVDEWPFKFDSTGRKMFRLFLNEEIPPFHPGSIDTEEESILMYGISYVDARDDMITQNISFGNYLSHDGPIRQYSYNSKAYNDDETPIQVLVILNRNVVSNSIHVTVDKNAKINHFSNDTDIVHVDYTAQFFVYNNSIEQNTITVNIDNSAYPLRLNVNFVDPLKAKK
ncbi:hypothetical protein [Ochrobactrum sp. AP1BH01-1]|uniref:hypothetical protein n=1 Tax=Ochrobactrum sp. AP1BH01-1 TaxID=2823874 RepID=UPI001B36D53E|nr:hypothetical protein [Ochrobactrum sp. AP1BH01-1]MBQ0710306.1 hypothetical protein [Ochrobactrum sp. AP1BH01-1]